MIEGLFNQPSYLAAKKTLDAVAVRQEAIASNIANLETPGYKRVDLAPTFRAELDRACASGDAREIAHAPYLCGNSTGRAAHRPSTYFRQGIKSPNAIWQPVEVNPNLPCCDPIGNVLGKLIQDVNTKQHAPTAAVDEIQSGRQAPL